MLLVSVVFLQFASSAAVVPWMISEALRKASVTFLLRIDCLDEY